MAMMMMTCRVICAWMQARAAKRSSLERSSRAGPSDGPSSYATSTRVSTLTSGRRSRLRTTLASCASTWSIVATIECWPTWDLATFGRASRTRTSDCATRKLDPWYSSSRTGPTATTSSTCCPIVMPISWTTCPSKSTCDATHTSILSLICPIRFVYPIWVYSLNFFSFFFQIPLFYFY